MPSTILLYVSFAFYYIGVTSQNVDKPGNCQSLDGGFKSKKSNNFDNCHSEKTTPKFIFQLLELRMRGMNSFHLRYSRVGIQFGGIHKLH